MSLNQPPTFRRLHPSEVKGSVSVKINEITDEDKEYAIAMFLAKNPEARKDFGADKPKQLLDSYGRPVRFKDKSSSGKAILSNKDGGSSDKGVSSNSIQRDIQKANEVDLSKGVLLKVDEPSEAPAFDEAANRFKALLSKAKEII
jgi:hypothetical protein